MASLSTHVLDTSSGLPAGGVAVSLARGGEDTWEDVDEATTDTDGRIPVLAEGLEPGIYRLRFGTADYGNPLYPHIDVVVRIVQGRDHYHIPLLLSPFGYTTYRGS